MRFKNSPIKIISFVIVIAIIGVSVYFSLPKILSAIGFVISLLLPFILGYIFSLLVDPLADLLEKKLRIPRGLSAILVILVTIGIIGSILTLVVWKLIDETRNLYEHFPSIYKNMQSNFEILSVKWEHIYNLLPSNIQVVTDNMIGDIENRITSFINLKSSPVVLFASRFAKSLPNVFISNIVFILSSFFMVSDAEKVTGAVKKMFRPTTIQRFRNVKENIQKYLGGYIKAQLTIMSIAFCIVFIGLSILKVDYAFLIAIGIAIFDALPFFGSGGILLPWTLVSFINSQPKLGVGLLIIYLSVILTRQMIEPKIVSQNIGMHPIVTLMSMYIGYKTLGVGGMILGPMIMIVIISFYKAGLFDSLIRLFKSVGLFLKKEMNNLKQLIKTENGGKGNE